MERKRFVYRGGTYTGDKDKSIKSDGCADITFINFGTADVTINSTFLPAWGGAGTAPSSFTDPAFGDEENTTDYPVTPTSAGTIKIVYRKKIYL